MSADDTTQIGEDVEESVIVDDAVEDEVYAGPREARLSVVRVDPWSVMKTAFVLSLGLAIVIVVAVVLVWGVLAALGVFSTVNEAIQSVAGSSGSVFNVQEFFSFGRVIGAAVVLAAINIVLVTALATLFAFMYNLTVPFARGIEVTLSED